MLLRNRAMVAGAVLVAMAYGCGGDDDNGSAGSAGSGGSAGRGTTGASESGPAASERVEMAQLPAVAIRTRVAAAV